MYVCYVTVIYFSYMFYVNRNIFYMYLCFYVVVIYFLCFFLGVMTLMFTNPIWVAKTRMCLQYDVGVKHGANAVLSDVHYNGMADCLIKTFRSEGFPGLYKVVNLFLSNRTHT